MTDRELFKMALNELERLCRTFSYPPDILYDTINALRARLAQPEEEEDYDAIVNKQLASLKAAAKVTFEDAVVRAVHKLYNAPPQREWVGLTNEEMFNIYGQNHVGKLYNLGRLIEAKLKEKNA